MTHSQLVALRTDIMELGAWIRLWRGDRRCNLKPTAESLEAAVTVYERALAECTALIESRQPKKELHCVFCGKTEGLRQIHDGGGYVPPEYICEGCFTPTDTGPCFDDLPEAEAA